MKQGHKYNSSGEVDWSAVTGVMDRAKGEGLASLKVSSPCFLPPGKSKASGATPAGPAAFEAPSPDDPATRRALAHSSRIYDALQVGSAPTQPGEGLGTVRDESGASVHHTWSTEPLPEGERAAAVERTQTFFRSAGWTVRRVPTTEGPPAVVAGHPGEHAVAEVATSTTGAVRVAVTTPATGPAPAGV
ncbi:hypothetical protein ACH4XT_22165 [Streptomyces avidinii]|uniref:hypothetical protein n=1 Tax=Streptomyces avidinii TaxID=1895 RepID=UPI00378FC21A